jgi:hypothetical protein
MYFMKKLVIASVLLFTVFTASAHAIKPSATMVQNDKFEFLNRLKGNWHVKGKSFGSPADVTMKWEWALNNQFMHLTYNIVVHPEGKPEFQFNGTAYYKTDSLNSYKAAWFDSGGDLHPITATDDGKTLTSIWGIKGNKMGKTLYRFVNARTIEIVDYLLRKDGSWVEFSRNILTKID